MLFSYKTHIFRICSSGDIHYTRPLCRKLIIVVCLSLLGTWQGEPWTNKSTILQLLVSVQSMIFCENPYYNEPGHELHANDQKSAAYNCSTRVATVQYAIEPWVGVHQGNTGRTIHPSSSSTTWRVVAETHLRLFAADIDAATSIASSKVPNNVQLQHQAKSIHEALAKQGYLV